MLKQSIWATIAIFIVWSILDFMIHGVLLKSAYRATANLWRPEDEMIMSLLSVVTLVFSICFVTIYVYFIASKSLLTGVKFGFILGLATGFSMGFGTFSYMPIPLSLALSWFFANFVELTLAGVIVGLMIKAPDEN